MIWLGLAIGFVMTAVIASQAIPPAICRRRGHMWSETPTGHVCLRCARVLEIE